MKLAITSFSDVMNKACFWALLAGLLKFRIFEVILEGMGRFLYFGT